jgi:hypothetical protein
LTEKLPHPTRIAEPERSRSDFIAVTVDRCRDPAWHFKFGVHKASKVGPGGEEAPTPDAPSQSLGLFHREGPAADVEVVGTLLPFEVDPVHWLEATLEGDGKTVVSSKPVAMRGGLLGDMVATWEGEDGQRFAGRFFASKWGPRIFCVCCRTTAESYPKLAEDFFVSIMTFAALDESFGHLAEKVRTVRGETPLAWKVAVPASWIVQPAPEGSKVSSFQAAQVPIEPTSDPETLVGKLSFAVVARSAVKVPRAAAKAFLDVLEENEFTLEDKDFEEEPSPPAFHKSWILVAKTERKGKPGELRCRVMLHERAWVIAGVIGQRRDDDSFAWMRNKRVLDVVTSTLVMRP